MEFEIFGWTLLDYFQDDSRRHPVRGHLRDHRHRLHPHLRGDGQAEPRLRGHRPRRRLPELGGREPRSPSPPRPPTPISGGGRRSVRLPRLHLQLPVYPAGSTSRVAPRDDRDAASSSKRSSSTRPRACPSPIRPCSTNVMLYWGDFGMRGDLMFVFGLCVLATVFLLYVLYRTKLGMATRAVAPAAGRGPALRHERAGDQLDHVHHRGGHRRNRRCHGRRLGRDPVAAPHRSGHREGAHRGCHRGPRQHPRCDHRRAPDRSVRERVPASCAASPSATCTSCSCSSCSSRFAPEASSAPRRGTSRRGGRYPRKA